MTVAEMIDALVDQLDRVQLGEEYSAGASMPWAVAFNRWQAYVTLVELIDRAVHDPLGEGASALLLTAAALHDEEIFELAFALSHVGEALTRGANAHVATEDHHG